jgi:hypothetical protein
MGVMQTISDAINPQSQNTSAPSPLMGTMGASTTPQTSVQQTNSSYMPPSFYQSQPIVQPTTEQPTASRGK